eukprot:TRINITY_DN65873_c4_g1_i1.p3 TRINITY_DN65873_c4_g1~~TRINITY_DN65873_c4_g1_i1.p3  ORF type:complete len:377 (-),score=202.84 TRINITY_DN65873_c4_g1_i1:165-1295(-)
MMTTTKQQAAVSLSGFVNVGKLEQLLQSMAARLEEQADRTARLERELAARPTSAAVAEMKRQHEAAMTRVQARCRELEQRVVVLEQVAARVQRQEAELGAVRRTLAAKQDKIAADQDAKRARAHVDARFKQVEQTKAAAQQMQHVEDSQHRLFEQMVALQNLMNTKVDRIEVPLLKAANQKLESLVKFQESIEGKMTALSAQVDEASAKMKEKEDKTVMVERMQRINELIGKKVDQDDLDKNIAARLESVEKAVKTPQFGHLMQSSELIASISQRMKDVVAAHAKLSQAVETLDKQVATKATAANAVSADEFKRQITALRREFEKERRHRHEHSSSASTDLVAIKEHQNRMDRKIGVMMRFVDWFSDVQLDNTTTM